MDAALESELARKRAMLAELEDLKKQFKEKTAQEDAAAIDEIRKKIMES